MGSPRCASTRPCALHFPIPCPSPIYQPTHHTIYIPTANTCPGISSDLLLRLYNLPRLYLILLSSFLFFIAVLLAIIITSPLYLFWVSSLNGLAYGMLFGVSPTIVSEAFGVNGLSTNWGAMTISCVIAGNVLNLLYGRVFDGNSQLGEEGRKVCLKGNGCYRGAYWGALAVTLLGAGVAVVMVGRMRRLQELGVRRRSVG
jgi:MFS family permease